MKKIITCLLTLSMMFMFSATAFASDFSGNAESELSNISDKIVTAVNDVYSDKNISITAEDINYDSAFKIYVDTNVFKLSTNVAGEIENALENGNYIYLLPIDTVNGTVVVNFQKGLPLSENAKAILSEEEQQEVLDNASFLALHYTKMEIQTMIMKKNFQVSSMKFQQIQYWLAVYQYSKMLLPSFLIVMV